MPVVNPLGWPHRELLLGLGHVALRLGGRLVQVEVLLPDDVRRRHGALPSPSFVDPPVPDLEEGLEIVRATPVRVLAEEIPACWRGAGRRGCAPCPVANRTRWSS